MTLSKLSKEIKELLEEGIAIIYVWKIGKSWRYSEFWYEDLNEKTFSMEDQISIDSIMEADKAATSFNGYEEFGSYTLKYIENRIKYGYLRSQQDIRENEIEKAFKKIEDKKEEVKKEEIIETEKEETKKIDSKYKIGQYLYNCGDMANDSGWYKITNVTIDKFGIFYNVEEIGGNRKNNYPEYCISDVDRMNGSTRIVTMEAKIKATNESYVYNQINALLEKDHDKRIEIVSKDYDERMKLIENEDEENNNESTEEVKKDHDKEWYQITDHEEEEKKEIINNLVETCNAGIKTEKEIKIYFNRLAKDQRTKILNKFQREKKGLDINLFYYSTFLNEEFYLSELQEIKHKIVKYINFLDSFKSSIIEEVNNYQEQIKNFKKEPNFKILKDEDFKIVKLDSDTTFGNGNLCYINEYTLYHKDLGYASMNGQTPYIPEGGRVALNDLINKKIIDSIPHWIKSTNFFKYTYRSRGFSPSCQPMNGLMNHEYQKEYKFEVLTYNRKLTCKEIAEFELIDLNE
jgi:hypothetical protein